MNKKIEDEIVSKSNGRGEAARSWFGRKHNASFAKVFKPEIVEQVLNMDLDSKAEYDAMDDTIARLQKTNNKLKKALKAAEDGHDHISKQR